MPVCFHPVPKHFCRGQISKAKKLQHLYLKLSLLNRTRSTHTQPLLHPLWRHSLTWNQNGKVLVAGAGISPEPVWIPDDARFYSQEVIHWLWLCSCDPMKGKHAVYCVGQIFRVQDRLRAASNLLRGDILCWFCPFSFASSGALWATAAFEIKPGWWWTETCFSHLQICSLSFLFAQTSSLAWKWPLNSKPIEPCYLSLKSSFILLTCCDMTACLKTRWVVRMHGFSSHCLSIKVQCCVSHR